MNKEDAELLMTAIQPVLVQHFFGGGGAKTARELKDAAEAMARLTVRIRVMLTADELDEGFLLHARELESAVMEGFDAEASDLIRKRYVRQADT